MDKSKFKEEGAPQARLRQQSFREDQGEDPSSLAQGLADHRGADRQTRPLPSLPPCLPYKSKTTVITRYRKKVQEITTVPVIPNGRGTKGPLFPFPLCI